MHGSTGGGWKRNAPALPRQLPTQPFCLWRDRARWRVNQRPSPGRRTSRACGPGSKPVSHLDAPQAKAMGQRRGGRCDLAGRRQLTAYGYVKDQARRRPHGPARLSTPRYGGGLWPTARLTSATSNRAARVQGPARQGVASLLGRDHTAGCDGCLRFSGSTGEAEPRELSYTTHRGLSDRPSSAVACSNTSVWQFCYATTLFVDATFMSGHDLAGPRRQEFTSFGVSKDQWFA